MHLGSRVLRVAVAVSIAAGTLLPTGATAQDSESKWITFAPRIWLTETQTADSPAIFKDAYIVPSYGASVSIAPPMLEGVSFLLMGLYGVGDGSGRYNPSIFDKGLALDVDLERIDVEGLLIYQIPDLPVYVFVGSRYVSLEEKMDGSDDGRSVDFKVENEVTIVKAGIGASGSLSENGNHRIFGNGSVGLGFSHNKTRFRLALTNVPVDIESRTNEKTKTPTMDVNVGYDYSFLGSLGLQLRYRVSMVFIDDLLNLNTTLVTHGPEISLAKSW
jgi:hypothetical protein